MSLVTYQQPSHSIGCLIIIKHNRTAQPLNYTQGLFSSLHVAHDPATLSIRSAMVVLNQAILCHKHHRLLATGCSSGPSTCGAWPWPHRRGDYFLSFGSQSHIVSIQRPFARREAPINMFVQSIDACFGHSSSFVLCHKIHLRHSQ